MANNEKRTLDQIVARAAAISAICAVLTTFVLIVQSCQLHTADETSRISNRSYVILNDLNFTPRKINKKTFWALTPEWQNAGNISTATMQSRVTFVVSGGNLPTGFTECEGGEGQSVPMALGPKASSKISFFAIDANPISLFQSKSPAAQKMFVWGWTKYKDALSSEQRETRFCYDVQYISGDPSKDSILKLSTALCSEGNCFDKVCQNSRTISPVSNAFCEKIGLRGPLSIK